MIEKRERQPSGDAFSAASGLRELAAFLAGAGEDGVADRLRREMVETEKLQGGVKSILPVRPVSTRIRRSRDVGHMRIASLIRQNRYRWPLLASAILMIFSLGIFGVWRAANHGFQRRSLIVMLDDPSGDRTLDGYNDGKVHKIYGVAKRLRINSITENTTLDITGLMAESVTIGSIASASCVRVRTSGNVTFTGPITGNSWVAVLADGDVRIAGVVGGGSKMQIKADGDVQIDQKIEGGPCTVVMVDSKQTFTTAMTGALKGDDKESIIEENLVKPSLAFKQYPFNVSCTSNLQSPKDPDFYHN